MNMNKKVRAFTITELIAAAILSALTVVAAMSVFNIMNTQFQDFQNQGEIDKEVGSLYSVMARDFEDGKLIETRNNTISITQADQKITYWFDKGSVERNVWIKQEEYKSVFKVQFNSISSFFQDKEINSGIVDVLNLKLIKNQQPLVLNFKKLYSSKELFDLENGHRY